MTKLTAKENFTYIAGTLVIYSYEDPHRKYYFLPDRNTYITVSVVQIF